MAFFEVSLGPVLWLLLSELFPLQVKGFAMSVGSFTCWLWTCVVAQVFSSMSAPDALGESGSFFFFAACTLASFFWIYAYVFETKGGSACAALCYAYLHGPSGARACARADPASRSLPAPSLTCARARAQARASKRSRRSCGKFQALGRQCPRRR